MIRFPAEALATLTRACEAAYPEEACGLIVGRADADGAIDVTRVEASPNVAQTPARRFEVDPALRLRLQRELRDTTDEIVGHFHSHPDGPAAPSATDLAEAWEPELVWVIAAVRAGRLAEVTAHAIDPASRGFRQIPLRREAAAARLKAADERERP